MSPGKVVDQKINGDDNGEGVENSEVASFFSFVDGGWGRWDFTEKQNGGEADGEGNDSEHEEKLGWVVSEQGLAEISEYGGAQTHIALENPRDGSLVSSVVTDASDEHSGVHPCGAIASHNQHYSHLTSQKVSNKGLLKCLKKKKFSYRVY